MVEAKQIINEKADLLRRREELKALMSQKKHRRLELLKQKKLEHDQNLIHFFTLPREHGGLPANPLQVELLEAWNDQSFNVFTYTGGNRIGKTTSGAIIAICTMAGKWLWNGKRMYFPHGKPRKIRYIGQDWENHVKTVIIPALKKWWPKSRPVSIKKNNVGAEYFWTDEETKSTIEIMTNKQDVDSFEGWDGDVIIYDEPPKRELRIANSRGLVDRQGRELFCMTLLKEAWVDREVIKARLPDGSPDPSVFNITGEIFDNVGYGITQKGVDDFIKKINEDEYSARIKGIPSYMSGLVCRNFNRRIHLVDRFKVPTDWIYDIGFDIHPRKQQAVLFCATNPQQNKYLTHEIWEHGDGTQIADDVIRMINYNSMRINRCICDPLAKGDSNNDNTTFDKIKTVLARHGHILETGTKDKNSGILQINSHLLGPNNQPSLFIFRDLKRTIYEIEGWMYDEETQVPQKIDDDMMENLYRILLLDTTYISPEDEKWWDDEDGTKDNDPVNTMTGY